MYMHMYIHIHDCVIGAAGLRLWSSRPSPGRRKAGPPVCTCMYIRMYVRIMSCTYVCMYGLCPVHTYLTVR